VVLPNADRAIIDRVKLEGYVLSSRHPVGRFKARFFTRLGFTAERWRLFEQALREQHLGQPAEAGARDAFGQAFTIRAMLQGPTCAAALVISVWFIRVGEDHPRFVTAYPGDSR
jgi:hypothetical protein